jgi:PIN domain nuclease of toxin-antitoxin system
MRKVTSALTLGRLPGNHMEPFDGMLVRQSNVHGFTILEPDRQISQYPVPITCVHP